MKLYDPCILAPSLPLFPSPLSSNNDNNGKIFINIDTPG